MLHFSGKLLIVIKGLLLVVAVVILESNTEVFRLVHSISSIGTHALLMGAFCIRVFSLPVNEYSAFLKVAGFRAQQLVTSASLVLSLLRFFAAIYFLVHKLCAVLVQVDILI